MKAKKKVAYKQPPRIQAKTITVAAFVRRILAEIKAEPTRLNMRRWVVKFKGEEVDYVAHLKTPACGTVACFAGWGMILLRQPHEKGGDLEDKASNVMFQLLNPTQYGGFEEVQELFSAVGVPHRPGTKAHAAFIIARTEAFLARHPELETRVIDVAARKVVKA